MGVGANGVVRRIEGELYCNVLPLLGLLELELQISFRRDIPKRPYPTGDGALPSKRMPTDLEIATVHRQPLQGIGIVIGVCRQNDFVYQKVWLPHVQLERGYAHLCNIEDGPGFIHRESDIVPLL